MELPKNMSIINSFNSYLQFFCSSTKIGKGQSLEQSIPQLILVHIKRRTDFRHALVLSHRSDTCVGKSIFLVAEILTEKVENLFLHPIKLVQLHFRLQKYISSLYFLK